MSLNDPFHLWHSAHDEPPFTRNASLTETLWQVQSQVLAGHILATGLACSKVVTSTRARKIRDIFSSDIRRTEERHHDALGWGEPLMFNLHDSQCFGPQAQISGHEAGLGSACSFRQSWSCSTILSSRNQAAQGPDTMTTCSPGAQALPWSVEVRAGKTRGTDCIKLTAHMIPVHGALEHGPVAAALKQEHCMLVDPTVGAGQQLWPIAKRHMISASCTCIRYHCKIAAYPLLKPLPPAGTTGNGMRHTSCSARPSHLLKLRAPPLEPAISLRAAAPLMGASGTTDNSKRRNHRKATRDVLKAGGASGGTVNMKLVNRASQVTS